jgi:hypothetical protein
MWSWGGFDWPLHLVKLKARSCDALFSWLAALYCALSWEREARAESAFGQASLLVVPLCGTALRCSRRGGATELTSRTTVRCVQTAVASQITKRANARPPRHCAAQHQQGAKPNADSALFASLVACTGPALAACIRLAKLAQRPWPVPKRGDKRLRQTAPTSASNRHRVDHRRSIKPWQEAACHRQ